MHGVKSLQKIAELVSHQSVDTQVKFLFFERNSHFEYTFLNFRFFTAWWEIWRKLWNKQKLWFNRRTTVQLKVRLCSWIFWADNVEIFCSKFLYTPSGMWSRLMSLVPSVLMNLRQVSSHNNQSTIRDSLCSFLLPPHMLQPFWCLILHPHVLRPFRKNFVVALRWFPPFALRDLLWNYFARTWKLHKIFKSSM